MGKIVRNGIEFSSTSDTADNINYNNSKSGLSAVTVQEAVDEINNKVSNAGLGEDENGMTIHDKLDILMENITAVPENPPVIAIGAYGSGTTLQGWATFDNSVTKYNKITVSGNKYAVVNEDVIPNVAIADNLTGINTVNIAGISKISVIARTNVNTISWEY